MNENSAILLSQASKSMHEPIVPMIFPALGAHISGAKFMYPDLIWKELCGRKAISQQIWAVIMSIYEYN